MPGSLRLGAPSRVLSLALLAPACSLQNFDALSDGIGSLGASGGAAGASSGAAAGDSSSGAAGSGDMSADAGADVDAGGRLNLLRDPGFEGGHQGWIAFGDSAIVDVNSEGRGGSRCISSINRTQTFEGPSLNIEPLVAAGTTYWLEAWVRVSGSREPVSMSLKTVCEGLAESYAPIVSVFAGDDAWVQLAAQFTTPTCPLVEFTFYFEGPASGVSFYVDDVGLYPEP